MTANVRLFSRTYALRLPTDDLHGSSKAIANRGGRCLNGRDCLSASRMVDTIKGVKRIAAKLAHFDGAYLRFVGDVAPPPNPTQNTPA
jgi:hypothetical protein